jgi:uncharacterized protein (TIGR03792 family)
MVIEWLTFQVAPENREAFIKVDSEIWTAALSQCPGYISKEVWISPEQDDQVIFIVRWQTREQWKSISEDWLEEVTARFNKAVDFPHKMLESKEYQVRRHPFSG